MTVYQKQHTLILEPKHHTVGSFRSWFDDQVKGVRPGAKLLCNEIRIVWFSEEHDPAQGVPIKFIIPDQWLRERPALVREILSGLIVVDLDPVVGGMAYTALSTEADESGFYDLNIRRDDDEIIFEGFVKRD